MNLQELMKREKEVIANLEKSVNDVIQLIKDLDPDTEADVYAVEELIEESYCDN